MSSNRPTSASRQRQAGQAGPSDSSSRPRSATRTGQLDPTVLGGIGSMVHSRVGGGSSVGGVNRAHGSSHGAGQGGQGYSAGPAPSGAGSAYGQPAGYASGRPQSAGAPEGGAGSRYRSASAGPSVGGRSSSGGAASNVASAGRSAGGSGSGWVEVGSGPGLSQSAGYNTQLRPSTAGMAPGGRSSVGGVYSGLMSPGQGAVPTPSFGKGASSAAELHPHHPQNDISSRLHGSPHHLMPSPYQAQQGQQGQGQGGYAVGPNSSGAWAGGLQYAAHGQPQQPQAPYTQPPGPTYGVHSWYTSAASGQGSGSGRPSSAGQRPTSGGIGVGGHVHTTPPQRGAGLWSYGSNGAEAPVKVMGTPSNSSAGGGGYGALLRPHGGPVLATVDALGPAAAALFHQQQAAVHSAQKAAVMTRMPAPAAGTYVSYSSTSSGVPLGNSVTRSPAVGSDATPLSSSAASPVTPRGGAGAWSSPGGRPGSASPSGRTLGISTTSPSGQPSSAQQQPVVLSGVARPVTPAATQGGSPSAQRTQGSQPGSAPSDRSSPRAASPSGASAGLGNLHTVAGMGYAEKFSAQQALRANTALSGAPAGMAGGPILGPDEEDGDDVSLPLGPKTTTGANTKQGSAALVVGGHGAGSPPPGEPGMLDGEGDDSPRTSPAPFEPSSAGGYSAGLSSHTAAAGRAMSTPTRAGSHGHGPGAATPSGTPGGYAATPTAVSMLGPNSAPSNGGLLASPLNLPQPVMPDFSHLPPEEADAARKAWQRQVQREREWLARQRLKQIVAHTDFDGRATTEFYGFGKVLGQGSFGEVRLAWHRLAGAKVAIKSYEKARLTEPNHWRRVQQEIRLMERLNHPNIIRQLEMIDSMKRIHIVMEFAGGGNLCTYVKSKQKLQEPEARKHFLQLLAAVEYMHDLGIIHRDIKLENVLFDEEQNVKLTDFGFSVAVRDPNKRLKIFCGTPSYMAPEITQRKEYLGRPVDVWSLAVLLYAMLAGHFPFTAKTYPELYKKIAAAQLKFPDHMSSSVRDLLRRMLHPDPLKRLTLAHARMHPWVAPSVASALSPPGQPGDKSLLISDDPSRDVNEAVLQRCEHLGFKRQKVVESILSRAKNAAATVYYLVLARMGRSARATGDGRAETRAADTSSARGGSNGQQASGAGFSSTAVGDAGGSTAQAGSSGMAPSMPARPSTAVASSRATAAAAQSQAHARAVTSAQIASGRTAGRITGLPLNLTSVGAGGATGPVGLGAPPAARTASASAGFVVGVHQSGSARSTASGGGVQHVGHGQPPPSTSTSSGSGPLGSSAASDGHFNLIGGLGSVASSTAGSTGAGHAGGGSSFVGIHGASPRSDRSVTSGTRGTGQGMGMMSMGAGEGKLDDSSRGSSVGSGRVGPQTGMPPSSYDDQSRISAVLSGSGSSVDRSESKAGGGSGGIPARSRSAGPAVAAASRPRSAAPGIASGARGGVLSSSGPVAVTAVTQGGMGVGMGSPTSMQASSTGGQGLSSIKGPVRATSAALPQGM